MHQKSTSEALLEKLNVNETLETLAGKQRASNIEKKDLPLAKNSRGNLHFYNAKQRQPKSPIEKNTTEDITVKYCLYD